MKGIPLLSIERGIKAETNSATPWAIAERRLLIIEGKFASEKGSKVLVE